MDLEPTSEQRALADGARRYLRGELPLSNVRSVEPGAGPDPGTWKRTGELGWLSVGLSEDAGGAGASAAEEVLFAHELGQELSPGPFLSSIIASHVASTAGDQEALDSLISGSAWAAAAFAEGEVGVDRTGVSGQFLLVDGTGARFAIAIDERAPAVALIDLPDAGQALRSIDEATPIARIQLDTAVRAFVESEDAARILVRASLLAAGVLAGSARASSDMAVEYAKVREQFGKPIGAFQAISHRCTDMAIRSDSAIALTIHAALALDEMPEHAPKLVAAAKAFAGNAAIENAAANIQIHGGSGFTYDLDAHFHLKRARVLDTLWGDRRSQLWALVDEAKAPVAA
jgi:alkylation response protein AidB-like acyl-CoA dehydrogenase